jgi:hypothetical protein
MPETSSPIHTNGTSRPVSSAVERSSRHLGGHRSAIPSRPTFDQIFHLAAEPIAIWALDDGRYGEVNDEFIRWSGIARDRLIDSDPFQLGRWIEADTFRAIVDETLRQPYCS